MLFLILTSKRLAATPQTQPNLSPLCRHKTLTDASEHARVRIQFLCWHTPGALVPHCCKSM